MYHTTETETGTGTGTGPGTAATVAAIWIYELKDKAFRVNFNLKAC